MKIRLLVVIIALIAVLAIATVGIVGCKPAEDTNVDPATAEEKVTVTWLNGTETLKEEKVVKGATINSWTPEVEGKTFMGWYSEISCTVAFDFTQAITADTDIFAGFRTDVYTEDTNVWCMIGTGAGTLKASNWSESAEVEENFKLTKLEEANVNKFEITATLYKGDQFQIRVKGTWDNQHGVGYLDGYTALAEAEGDIVGEVKNAEGERVFYANGGFGDSAKGWNANVEMAGIYKFTLQTFPGSSDYDVIYWEKTGEAPVIEETHKMYIAGTMNEWAGKEVLPEHKMTKESDGDHFIIYYTVTEADYASWTEEQSPGKVLCAALKVKNEVNGMDYGVDGGQDNIFLTAGTYAIRYNKVDNKVQVEECKYYVVGTLVDGEGNAVNFSIVEGVAPVMTVAEGVATVEYTAVDVTGNAAYSWMTDQGKPGICAVKVVYGTTLGIRDWFSDDANGGDNFYLEAGTYTIALNIETKTVTVAPVTAE